MAQFFHPSLLQGISSALVPSSLFANGTNPPPLTSKNVATAKWHQGGLMHMAKVAAPSQIIIRPLLSEETRPNGMFIWTYADMGLPLLQAKPVPSHTPANACTSPVVPALKPSYSQVTRLGIRACDPGKQHVIGACDPPRYLQVLWGSHDPRARDPEKKTGDLSRDWSATRSGDYRYTTHPLNHPVGTTNGGVGINKVVQLRIIGAQPQQPQQRGNPQPMAPQRGKGPTCVPYVNQP